MLCILLFVYLFSTIFKNAKVCVDQVLYEEIYMIFMSGVSTDLTPNLLVMPINQCKSLDLLLTLKIHSMEFE